MKHKIAIIGSGKAGTALQTGLSGAGYEVRFAKKGQITETTTWADVIVLAVPFGVVRHVAHALETAADGKTVIDVTNALTPDFQLAVGFTTSGAEELQKVLPRAKAIGFDPVDAGPLKNARSLEPLAFLNIQLSWVLGNGPNVGFKFVH